MSKNNKRAKGKKKNNKKSLNQNQEGMVSIQKFMMPKNLVFFKDIVPPRVMTKLKFLMNGSLTNAGFNTASKQLYANGCFDTDPSLGSPGLTGFAEWTGFYHRYRVWGNTAKCTFMNRESFPVIVNLGYEPDPHAANAKTIGYYEDKHQSTAMAPISGGPTVKLSMTRKAIDVVGDEICMTDIGYTGTSGSNPTSLYYTSISTSSAPLGAVLVNGVAVRYEVTYLVEFYEARQILV